MKKLTRRLLALTLAILMVSALVLNVSALSSYRNIEIGAGNGVCYVSASCTTTTASAKTITTDRTAMANAQISLYGSTRREAGTLFYRNSSEPALGGSGFSVTSSRIIDLCVADHYLEGGAIYTGEITPD